MKREKSEICTVRIELTIHGVDLGHLENRLDLHDGVGHGRRMVALLFRAVAVVMLLMVMISVVLLDVEDAVDVDVLLVRVGRARPVQVEGVRGRPHQIQGDREVVGVWKRGKLYA